MYIKKVIRPARDDNGNIYEADVIVSDGQNEILCYYYSGYNCKFPDLAEGGKVEIIPALIMDSEITLADNKEYVIEKDKKDHFGYKKIQGEVIDIKKDEILVKVGGLIIEADKDELGKDLVETVKKGDFVEFSVCRFDVNEDEL